MAVARKKIFVLGTGRSGTCWMGDILGQHSEIRSYVETRPLFDWVTQAAINRRDEPEMLPRIVAEYERLYEESRPQHFADKCHPSIWLAEKLSESFSDAYFIGIARDVEPTVASMLKHSGVRRWCEEWSRYEVPNRFLGITEYNLNWYRGSSIIERCVARWYAHHKELARLQTALRERLLLVKYEVLVLDTQSALRRVREFLKLHDDFPTITPVTSSLDKWKVELAPNEVKAIHAALEFLGAEDRLAQTS